MILGIIQDIGVAIIGTDITIIHITTDGMADGILISTGMVTFTINQEDQSTTTSHSKDRDIRPDQTEYLQEALHSEEVLLSKAYPDVRQEQFPAQLRTEGQLQPGP